MIFILLLILAVICYALLIYYLWQEEDGESAICAIFISPLLFTLAFILIYGPIQGLTSKPTIYTPRSARIISLSSDSNVKGSFFIGSGQIDEVEYYFSYVVREDGNYVRDKTPMSKASIKEMPEGAEFDPSIVWDRINYKCPSWVSPCWKSDADSEYVFQVPYGTVIQRFAL